MFAAIPHLLIAFLWIPFAIASTVQPEQTSLAISQAAASLGDAPIFADTKERNVGNTPNLRLAPLPIVVTYKYNCPSGPSIERQAFGFLVQWQSRERRLTFEPLHKTPEKIMDITMHGTYPYWSTAVFERRICIIAGGQACSYFYNGQIVVRIAERLTGQGVWKWGEGYRDPVISRYCVPGNQCKTGASEICTVMDVY